FPVCFQAPNQRLRMRSMTSYAIKGSDIFIRALENEGVEYVFGVPGEENLDMLESLRTSRIKVVVTRHEQVAGFKAATYGRLTGLPRSARHGHLRRRRVHDELAGFGDRHPAWLEPRCAHHRGPRLRHDSLETRIDGLRRFRALIREPRFRQICRG